MNFFPLPAWLFIDTFSFVAIRNSVFIELSILASDIEQVENDILMQFVDGGSAVPHPVLYCLFFNLHIRVINEQILFLVKLRVILQYTIQ